MSNTNKATYMDIKLLPKSLRQNLRSAINIQSAAQCVSQLVLNSLDAKSTSIAVRVNLVAHKIQVIDNGAGITKKNLKLVGVRYTTNKYYSVTDLKKHRNVFGFRGEALASIIKLSEIVEITSRTANNPKTYCKLFKNGKYESITDITQRSSPGTTVKIENFLYNMPVRQHLISDNSSCVEEIRTELEQMAIIHPRTSFSLRNDCTGEILLQTNKSKFVYQRIANMHGKNISKALKRINFKENDFALSGLIGTEVSKLSNKLQLIYVNKRFLSKGKIYKIVNSLLNKSYIIKTRTEHCEHSPKIPPQGKPNQTIFIINIQCSVTEYEVLDYKKIVFKNREKIFVCVENAILKFLQKHNLIEIKKQEHVADEQKLLENKNTINASQLMGVIRGFRALRTETGNNSGNAIEDRNEACDVIERFPVDDERMELITDNRSASGKRMIMDKFLKSVICKKRKKTNSLTNFTESTRITIHTEITKEKPLEIQENEFCSVSQKNNSVHSKDILHTHITTFSQINCLENNQLLKQTGNNNQFHGNGSLNFNLNNKENAIIPYKDLLPRSGENKCMEIEKAEGKYLYKNSRNFVRKCKYIFHTAGSTLSHRSLSCFRYNFDQFHNSQRKPKFMFSTDFVKSAKQILFQKHFALSNSTNARKTYNVKMSDVKKLPYVSSKTINTWYDRKKTTDPIFTRLQLNPPDMSRHYLKSGRNKNLDDITFDFLPNSIIRKDDCSKMKPVTPNYVNLKSSLLTKPHLDSTTNTNLKDITFKYQPNRTATNCGENTSFHQNNVTSTQLSQLLDRNSANNVLSSIGERNQLNFLTDVSKHYDVALDKETANRIFRKQINRQPQINLENKKIRKRETYVDFPHLSTDNTPNNVTFNKTCNDKFNSQPLHSENILNLFRPANTANKKSYLDTDTSQTIYRANASNEMKKILGNQSQIFVPYKSNSSVNKKSANFCKPADFFPSNIASPTKSSQVKSLATYNSHTNRNLNDVLKHGFSNFKQNFLSSVILDNTNLRKPKRLLSENINQCAIDTELNKKDFDGTSSVTFCVKNNNSNNQKSISISEQVNSKENNRSNTSQPNLISEDCDKEDHLDNSKNIFTLNKKQKSDRTNEKFNTSKSSTLSFSLDFLDNIDFSSMDRISEIRSSNINKCFEEKVGTVRNSVEANKENQIETVPCNNIDNNLPQNIENVSANNSANTAEKEIANTSKTNEETEWIKQKTLSGTSLYVNCRTGMSSFQNEAAKPSFTMTERYVFMPKGMSPILHTTSNKGENLLSPTSKNNLYETIAQTENNELRTVKWLNYLKTKDTELFFNELYKNNQYYETEIPVVNEDKKLRKHLENISFSKDIFSNIEILNQWDYKFLVTKVFYNNGIVLILFDQHAVHERIRLEKILKGYEENENGKLKSARCTIPITVNISNSEYNMLKVYRESFEYWGLLYKIQNSETVIFTHIPTCWQSKDDNTILDNENSRIKSVLERLIKEKSDCFALYGKMMNSLPTCIQDVMKMEACKGAIKFGDKVNLEDALQYIKELSLCNLPFQCAHGRPTMLPIFQLSANCSNENKQKVDLSKLRNIVRKDK